MGISEICCEGSDCIHLALDRIQWRALMNKAVNYLRFSGRCELGLWSSGLLLHVVSCGCIATFQRKTLPPSSGLKNEELVS
jgi:hypothetical protein